MTDGFVVFTHPAAKVAGHPRRRGGRPCLPRRRTARRQAPDDAIHMKGGPFANRAGRLENLADSARVRVILNPLGREVRAELPICKVQAV